MFSYHLLSVLIDTDRHSFQGLVTTATTKDPGDIRGCVETCIASQNKGSRVFDYLKMNAF